MTEYEPIPLSRCLEILKNSLAKKKALFDKKLDEHMESVRSVNGSPLNDKRGGAATMQKWEKQNLALRTLDLSIKKTEKAIEAEERKIAVVSSFPVPECLWEFLTSGSIVQWRRHPRFFFVEGVEKARIVVLEDGKIAARYVGDIPTREQFELFKNVFNAARKIQEILK